MDVVSQVKLMVDVARANVPGLSNALKVIYLTTRSVSGDEVTKVEVEFSWNEHFLAMEASEQLPFKVFVSDGELCCTNVFVPHRLGVWLIIQSPTPLRCRSRRLVAQIPWRPAMETLRKAPSQQQGR